MIDTATLVHAMVTRMATHYGTAAPDAAPGGVVDEHSLAAIENILGLRVPDWLVTVTKLWPDYTQHFYSIGDDFGNPNHIIQANFAGFAPGIRHPYYVISCCPDGNMEAIMSGTFPIDLVCSLFDHNHGGRINKPDQQQWLPWYEAYKLG